MGEDRMLLRRSRPRRVPDWRLRWAAGVQRLRLAPKHISRVLAEPVPKPGFLRHLGDRRIQRAHGVQP